MPIAFIKKLLKKDDASSPEAFQQTVLPAKQVYEGRVVPRPEFAEGIEASRLVNALKENVECKYSPYIENQRLYDPARKDGKGDMAIEFEGIAGSCTALKKYGLQIAQKDGYGKAYRYVDVNHIFDCCCGDPENCRFYNASEIDRKAVQRRFN